MRIKLTGWALLVLFCGSLAHATPILYTFINASGFTLDGMNYPGAYLSDPGPRLMLILYADTNNVTTSGDFYTNTPGSQFVVNRSAVGVVSYGGITLATISDPVELVVDNFFNTAYLFDPVSQEALISSYTDPYDGVSAEPEQLLSFEYPIGSFDTNLGELTITDSRLDTTFEASLSETAPVPEPASIIFVSTGALGLWGALRRYCLVT